MSFRVLRFCRLTVVLLCSNTADGHEVTRLGADVNKTIDGFRFSDIWQKNRRFAASEKKNKWVEKRRKIRVLKSNYVMLCACSGRFPANLLYSHCVNKVMSQKVSLKSD